MALANVITIKNALGGRLGINAQLARACSLFSERCLGSLSARCAHLQAIILPE